MGDATSLGAGLLLVNLALTLLGDEAELLKLDLIGMFLGGEVAEQGGGVEARIDHAVKAPDGLIPSMFTSIGSRWIAIDRLFLAISSSSSSLHSTSLTPLPTTTPSLSLSFFSDSTEDGGTDRRVEGYD